MDKWAKNMACARLALALLVCLAGGCTQSVRPFVEYQHYSDPTVKNDGWDYVCAGYVYNKNLQVNIGACENIRHGWVLNGGIRYIF